ncbi:MAG: type II secretion system F family protein [Actinobacteria bacterium]|nr:type II secretion system F family protein [Actinomycetota bacterium]
MLVLALVLLGGAIAAGIWAVGSTVEEKAVVRASLRQLDGYEVNNVRDAELLKPVGERTVQPLQERLVEIGKRITPDGYSDKVRQKMTSAGIQSPDAVDRFIATRVVALAMIPVLLVLLFGVLGLSGMLGLAAAGFVVLVAVLGPDAILDRKIEDRQHQIQVKLPDVLDLLVISVEAGLGFEQALDRTVAAVPGALTDEFARMLGEVRAGASRAEAMRAMEARCDVPELRSFVLAILQADTFGVSIGRVLRAQADEMRIKRRQLAQEKAQKAPLKMLIPMVFCVFPALFVVVIGPAIINIRDAF